MGFNHSVVYTIIAFFVTIIIFRLSPIWIPRFLLCIYRIDTHSYKEYAVAPTELICVCKSEQQLIALQRRACKIISQLPTKLSHIQLEANIETLTLKLAWDSDGTDGKSTYKPPDGKKIARQLERKFPGMVASFDLNRGEPE